MIITTKLTQKDFINISFFLFFRKLTIIFFMSLMVVWFVVYTILNISANKGSYYDFIPMTVGLSILPLMTYLSAKRNFKANPRISETIEYHIKPSLLTLKGESFTTDYTWNQLYNVNQTRNWIIVWQTRQVANFIPKRDLSTTQIAELKKILDKHLVRNSLGSKNG